jgi:hypothetical protein
MAEVLTFGYASKFGMNGLRFKCKAISDGFRIKIRNSRKGRPNFRFLKKSIPLDQLTFTKIDKIVKIIANKIFVLNMRLVK